MMICDNSFLKWDDDEKKILKKLSHINSIRHDSFYSVHTLIYDCIAKIRLLQRYG